MQLDGQFANERFTSENDDAEFERILAEALQKPEPDYSRLKILVSPVFPPIPSNKFDYSAIDDATYDLGSPTGYGPTRQAAILDLIEQIAQRDDTEPLQILLELVNAKEKKCTDQPAAL
jgi:hypothetical protein